MFYSQLILAKKGPLGTIWIAAHLERKLRKNQVTETNISVSVGECSFLFIKQDSIAGTILGFLDALKLPAEYYKS
jgi:hypothetical protein